MPAARRSKITRFVSGAGAASLLLVAALAPVGCSCSPTRTAQPAETTLAPAPYTDATPTLEPSATTAPVKTGPITTTEAAQLEAELQAIEKELDSLDLPSDADFNDLENALK